MTAEFGGLRFELAANFGAARDIAKQVADPLAIAREAALEAMMAQVGQVYHPKFSFTVDNVPVILHIGAKAAGEKVTLAEVQDVVFNAGFLVGKAIASDYLALIVTPRSEETTSDEDREAAGE
jgi:hypothetical protein